MNNHEGQLKENTCVPELYKTRRCVHHSSSHRCPHGMRCLFAHGDAEMRTVVQNLRDGLTTHMRVHAFRRAVRREAAAVAGVAGGAGEATAGAAPLGPAQDAPIAEGEPKTPPTPPMAGSTQGKQQQQPPKQKQQQQQQQQQPPLPMPKPLTLTLGQSSPAPLIGFTGGGLFQPSAFDEIALNSFGPPGMGASGVMGASSGMGASVGGSSSNFSNSAIGRMPGVLDAASAPIVRVGDWNVNNRSAGPGTPVHAALGHHHGQLQGQQQGKQGQQPGQQQGLPLQYSQFAPLGAGPIGPPMQQQGLLSPGGQLVSNPHGPLMQRPFASVGPAPPAMAFVSSMPPAGAQPLMQFFPESGGLGPVVFTQNAGGAAPPGMILVSGNNLFYQAYQPAPAGPMMWK